MPADLQSASFDRTWLFSHGGGTSRGRTGDLQIFSLPLYLLSYPNKLKHQVGIEPTNSSFADYLSAAENLVHFRPIDYRSFLFSVNIIEYFSKTFKFFIVKSCQWSFTSIQCLDINSKKSSSANSFKSSKDIASTTSVFTSHTL